MTVGRSAFPPVGRRLAAALGLFGLGLGVSSCGQAPEPPDLGNPAEEVWSGDPDEILAARQPVDGTEEDWSIAEDKLTLVRQLRLDTLPYFGDLVGAVGERFVGTPYEPHTLEVPGPERLVVNFGALDCVTFVETALTLARLVRTMPPAVLDDPESFEDRYREELTGMRYRGGAIDGYASRLHYFSEWLSDNASMGLVEPMSRELGGAADNEPIDFMSTHPDAYAQLSDLNTLAAISRIEAQLNNSERFYIPEDEIAEKANLIRNGDIIAATSTVEGLDIAHTGIALWRGGVLRLLHAPLVGESVELSEESLSDRILRIEGQDGIMVARPRDPGHWLAGGQGEG